MHFLKLWEFASVGTNSSHFKILIHFIWVNINLSNYMLINILLICFRTIQCFLVLTEKWFQKKKHRSFMTVYPFQKIQMITYGKPFLQVFKYLRYLVELDTGFFIFLISFITANLIWWMKKFMMIFKNFWSWIRVKVGSYNYW